MRKHIFLAALGAMALSMAGFANTLSPGQEMQPPDALSLTGTKTGGESGGTFTPTFSANFNAALYRGNPICPTCLTFAYQVSNIAAVGTGAGIIEMLTASAFSGFTTDLGFVVLPTAQDGFLAGGTAPLTVGRSSGPGAVVDFDYPNITGGSNNLGPGGHTAVLLIETNATTFFDRGLFAIIDGSTSTLPTFAATAPTSTPEPDGLALAGLGFLGFGMLLKRVRRQA